jgi:hypothetical protein
MNISNEQIDRMILAATETRWRKIAFVISKVEAKIGTEMTDSERILFLIAERIEYLVRAGELIAQGDVKNWRFSEIRKPT